MKPMFFHSTPPVLPIADLNQHKVIVFHVMHDQMVCSWIVSDASVLQSLIFPFWSPIEGWNPTMVFRLRLMGSTASEWAQPFAIWWSQDTLTRVQLPLCSEKHHGWKSWGSWKAIDSMNTCPLQWCHHYQNRRMRDLYLLVRVYSLLPAASRGLLGSGLKFESVIQVSIYREASEGTWHGSHKRPAWHEWCHKLSLLA